MAARKPFHPAHVSPVALEPRPLDAMRWSDLPRWPAERRAFVVVNRLPCGPDPRDAEWFPLAMFWSAGEAWRYAESHLGRFHAGFHLHVASLPRPPTDSAPGFAGVIGRV